MLKAGDKVRNLAKKRKYNAFGYLCGAVFLALAPIILYFFLKITEISIFIYSICWVSTVIIMWRRKKRPPLTQPSKQVAKGLEDIGLLLKSLQHRGWKIEYNVPVSYWGDADVFLRSPKGRCFVVDVKNYIGNIFFDGSRLLAIDGNSVYTDQNMLETARGQATSLQQKKDVRSVIPILCFTHAHLEMGNKQIQNVYVIRKNVLLPLLKKLG